MSLPWILQWPGILFPAIGLLIAVLAVLIGIVVHETHDTVKTVAAILHVGESDINSIRLTWGPFPFWTPGTVAMSARVPVRAVPTIRNFEDATDAAGQLMDVLEMTDAEPPALHRRVKSREASNSRPALAVPNQLGEDDFHLPLGLHLLIVGTTGSGKTTLLSNILLAFDEFLREGSVRLLAIDLKDGVSATACAGFYTKIASTLPEAVDLLQETVELVKKRNAWLKSRHETEIRWSMQTPLIVILIDEALQLYGAASPEQKKLQAQAQEALDALLLTGRSAGIMVIAAVQDPRKEFFKSRDHYPERMALALNSKDEAKMALGDEAVSRGAAPWLISHSTPGRGWYYDDLGHKAIRFQVPPVQADEIRTMSSILEPFTHQQDIKSLTPQQKELS